MSEHKLKTWPTAFDAMVDGRKRFEWRKDDRGFEVGDILVLEKWDPGATTYSVAPGLPSTFRENSDRGAYVRIDGVVPTIRVRVTYILRGLFGVPDGYCVMSIEPVKVEQKGEDDGKA